MTIETGTSYVLNPRNTFKIIKITEVDDAIHSQPLSREIKV